MNLRAFFLMTFLYVATCIKITAQVEPFYEVFFKGVTSTLTNNSYGGFNMPGVGLGGAYEEVLAGPFSWRGELYFVQKGDREVLSNDPLANQNFTQYRARINMLELAALLRYDYKPLHLIFETGLAPGFTVGQSESNIQGASDFGRFSTFAISGLLGVHYQFHEHWTAGFRMSFSLTPNRKLNTVGGPILYDYLGGQGQRAQLIALMFGYRF
jgi:hypothetical protein